MDIVSTIDQQDVQRFDQLSAKWWDRDGPMKPLHLFTPIRIDYILQAGRRAGLMRGEAGQAIKRGDVPLAGLELLDIGCGGGLLAEPLARLGANVTGIDASEKAIQVAQEHAEKSWGEKSWGEKSWGEKSELNVNYRALAAEQLAAMEGFQQKFDLIIASEVIEHVTDRYRFLEAVARMLKPEGVVVVTTLNKSLASWVGAKLMAEYVLSIIPVGTHEFNQFMSPDQLCAECAQHNIGIDNITGFVPNLAGGFSFSPITAINYGASGQFLPRPM